MATTEQINQPESPTTAQRITALKVARGLKSPRPGLVTLAISIEGPSVATVRLGDEKVVVRGGPLSDLLDRLAIAAPDAVAEVGKSAANGLRNPFLETLMRRFSPLGEFVSRENGGRLLANVVVVEPIVPIPTKVVIVPGFVFQGGSSELRQHRPSRVPRPKLPKFKPEDMLPIDAAGGEPLIVPKRRLTGSALNVVALLAQARLTGQNTLSFAEVACRLYGERLGAEATFRGTLPKLQRKSWDLWGIQVHKVKIDRAGSLVYVSGAVDWFLKAHQINPEELVRGEFKLRPTKQRS